MAITTTTTTPYLLLPDHIQERVLIEPFNGYNEDDGVWGLVYSDDPVDDHVIFEGFYKTYDAAVRSIVSAYFEGCFI